MTEEIRDAFDDELERALPVQRQPGVHHEDATHAALGERGAHLVPRLLARLYRAAAAPLRANILQQLLRPLGLLSVAAVASGAFAGLVHRQRGEGLAASFDELAAFSTEQIGELVQFVVQVSPQAVQEAARVLADAPWGAAGFSALAALALVRLLDTREHSRRH